MYGSDGPGGDSGGPSRGSETVSGTDVRNRQDSAGTIIRVTPMFELWKARISTL